MYQDRNEVIKDSCVAEIAIRFLLGYQLALNDQDGILVRLEDDSNRQRLETRYPETAGTVERLTRNELDALKPK